MSPDDKTIINTLSAGILSLAIFWIGWVLMEHAHRIERWWMRMQRRRRG